MNDVNQYTVTVALLERELEKLRKENEYLKHKLNSSKYTGPLTSEPVDIDVQEIHMETRELRMAGGVDASNDYRQLHVRGWYTRQDYSVFRVGYFLDKEIVMDDRALAVQLGNMHHGMVNKITDALLKSK